MAIPQARSLTNDEVRDLLSLSRDDITKEKLMEMFSVDMHHKAPLFNTYDTFTLPAGRLYNKESVKTTIGRYLVNMFTLPLPYLKKYGYQNKSLDKHNLGDMEDDMGAMVLTGEMTTKEYAEYLDNGEWLGMGVAYYLVPTMDYDINVPIPDVIKLRDSMFNKYADGIKSGDINVANKIEKDVLDLAKKDIEAKGNEAYDFFKSGVGNFENNYKKTSVMAGAVENPYTHKLDILKSNYIDGIDKNEYSKFANLTVIGGYSRGVATQASGYETKKINNSMQVIVLDEKGSDCGSKEYIKVKIEKKVKSMYLYRYIYDPNSKSTDKLTLLTKDNIDKWVGETVMMRSPMCCKGEKICNKCAGELYYMMGVKNAGLLGSTLSGVLLNRSMKQFHDATVKFDKINIEDYIIKR
jgi:hypothetical protein